MNHIANTSIENDADMIDLLDRGFSRRQIDYAHRLLDTLEYDPEGEDWDERRRFLLFDKLAKIAMGHAVEAERGGHESTECGIVAQCAMEIVYRGRAFSPSLIAEICSALPDDGDSAVGF